MKKLMQILVSVLILFVSCSILAAEEENKSEEAKKEMSDQGIVTGKVSFGPLRPGPQRVDEPEPSAENSEILRKMYSTHKVKVLGEDTKKVVREVEINPQGIYKAELPPGIYFLQITPPGIGRFQKQAIRVEVTAGKTVHADISIDTGMR